MSEKVVTKYPKRQERGKTSHETYMKRLKEKILEDNQLSTSSSTDNSTSSTPSHPARHSDILMSMVSVYLLSMPLLFVYFLHMTLPRLRIKNLSMKNRINHQNNVICFRSDLYNK